MKIMINNERKQSEYEEKKEVKIDKKDGIIYELKNKMIKTSR